MLVFSVLLSNLAPILIMPIFNKFVPLDDEHADLAERLLKLAEKANTKVRGVFKFDMSRRTKSANAALTGIGNTRRIVLGDTLIDEFTPDEIETVLAHELGHHVHKDIPVLDCVWHTNHNPWSLSGFVGIELDNWLLWICRPCGCGGLARFGTNPRRIWTGHHAAGECHLPLAREHGR